MGRGNGENDEGRTHARLLRSLGGLPRKWQRRKSPTLSRGEKAPREKLQAECGVPLTT